MKYWLVKSEPGVWSWEQQVKKSTTHWDGVRNHAAALNLKTMKKGDLAFFYHSNEGKEIVGVVEITREAYPDPGDAQGRFVMVDVTARETFKNPVTLAQVKADPRLENMALVRLSRLSVQPVTDAEWKLVYGLGNP